MNRRLGWTLAFVRYWESMRRAQAEQTPGTDIVKILRQFPGYHLLTMAEREANARAFLLRHSSKSSRSIVHADFDGDGHPDYARLLKHDGTERPNLLFSYVPVTLSAELCISSM